MTYRAAKNRKYIPFLLDSPATGSRFLRTGVLFCFLPFDFVRGVPVAKRTHTRSILAAGTGDGRGALAEQETEVGVGAALIIVGKVGAIDVVKHVAELPTRGPVFHIVLDVDITDKRSQGARAILLTGTLLGSGHAVLKQMEDDQAVVEDDLEQWRGDFF